MTDGLKKENFIKGKLLVRFLMILDNLPFDVWMKDENEKYIYMNKRYAETFLQDGERTEMMYKTYAELTDDEKEIERAHNSDCEVLKTGREHISEVKTREKGYRRIYKKLLRDDKENPIGILGVGEDINMTQKAIKRLKQSEAKFRTLFEEAPMGIGIFDLVTGQAYQVNKRFAEIAGLSKSEALTVPWLAYTHPEDIEKNTRMNMLLQRGEIPMYMMEKRFRHKDGKIIWVNLTVAKYYQDDDTSRSICMVEDITARKEAEERVRYLSNHDELTGVYNRRYFNSIEEEMTKEENRPLSLIMADVNGLKMTNDVFGHVAGDRLLKRTAEIMAAVCGSSASICRTGGDEFTILLPRTTGEQARYYVQEMKRRISVPDESLRVVHSVSFGCDVLNDDIKDLEHLFSNAEGEMYKNKLFESPKMRKETIRLVVAGMRDKGEIFEHSRSVMRYAMRFGKALQLPDEQLADLKTAAFMHDIGSACKKNGKDSEKEFDKATAKHSETGYQILRLTKEYKHLAEFVLHHHESFDGTGFPSGLRGRVIPLESRIIAVADEYVHRLSELSDDDGNKEKTAVEGLKKLAGSKLDPELVDIFTEEILKEKDTDD
ncbi:MAG: diguanylate cyclase [Clostridia bacterium]|nr:diguanylate cyclase [Clostridia bacterium]